MKSLAPLALGLALLGSIAAPMSALAYLSPNEVFGAEDLPSTRGAEQIQAERQAAAASSRAAAQEALVSIEEESSSSESSVASSSENSSLGLFDEAVQYELRQERLKSAADEGQVLHSGAPIITKTGPESTIAVIALFVAAMCTLAFCFYRGRKLAALSA